MKKSKFLAMGLILVLGGCVSMFGDSSDKITIQSNVPDTDILINGNEAGETPVVYSLPRGKTVLLTATKKGCSPRTAPTEQSIDGLYWLNIFVWPGLLIDAATGSMHKADPTVYTVTPNCS